MRVCIGTGIQTFGIDWRQDGALLDQVGLTINPNYPELTPERQAEVWKCNPADAARARWLRERIAAIFPPDTYISECVVIENVMHAELHDAEFVTVFKLADDFSDAETGHHSDSWCVCSACGNRYQDPNYLPKAKASRLKPRPLGSFYAPLKLFCTQAFIDLYAKHGLTGLSFSRWSDVFDRAKNPLHLIHVHQHQWQDRAGVCDTCGMKTNLTTSYGCFNVHERFLYDFQYLRTFCMSGDPTEQFVLSRRALDFMVRIDKIVALYREQPTSLTIPIFPGDMEDLIWPEPRLCTPEHPPQYMLRANWEQARQANAQGRKRGRE